MPPAQRDFCVGLAMGRIATDEDAGAPKAKKKAASDDEETPKPQEDMKSKIMKGLLPF
jgi:hypothetical protein